MELVVEEWYLKPGMMPLLCHITKLRIYWQWIDAETHILLCEFGKSLAFVILYPLHDMLALFFLNHNTILDLTGFHETSVLNKIQFSAMCLLILVRRFVQCPGKLLRHLYEKWIVLIILCQSLRFPLSHGKWRECHWQPKSSFDWFFMAYQLVAVYWKSEKNFYIVRFFF